MCFKAALEGGRAVIIASGMQNGRKCQIKTLTFKWQEHSDRKREDENKVPQIGKIISQLLPNQTLPSMDLDTAYSFTYLVFCLIWQ